MNYTKLKRWLLTKSPLITLLSGLSTVLLFGNERGTFYRPGHHDYVSSEHLANAVNLSSKHNFLVFTRQIILDNGTSWYDPYNRFPPGGYFLIKLATLPFEDLSTKIYIARVLMLLFFVGTGVIAFWLLCRLFANKWSALMATLMSLSSYYFLYYNDMISNEVAIDLFFVVVIFHSMVIFLQEDRFQQLAIKSCFVLLFGWHIFGLLTTFIALGMAREAFYGLKNLGGIGYRNINFKHLSILVCGVAARVVTSRYVLLAVITVTWGTLVLIQSLVREYLALNQTVSTPLTSLPSFQSMLRRTGLDTSQHSDEALQMTTMPTFLRQQLGRIGVLSTPFSFQKILLGFRHGISLWIFSLYTGIVVAICIVGAILVRYKMLMSTLILAGFGWAIPMRYNAYIHDYEAVFYFGIPLTFFVLIATIYERLFKRHIWLLVIIALATFTISAFQMGQIGYDTEDSEFHEAMVADFDVIRRITFGENIIVPSRNEYSSVIEFTKVRHGLDYYLSGSGIILQDDYLVEEIRLPRYIIRRTKIDKVPNLLTPENRLVFLYDLLAS